LSNAAKLKTYFFSKFLSEFGSLKIRNSQKAKTCQTRKLKIPKTFQISLLCRAPKLSQATKTLKLKALSKTDCVSSGDRNMAYNVGSYTQVRIAGDFLSSYTKVGAGYNP
jgi:hypothetical protein